MSVTFLVGGQGGQYFGMGTRLYDSSPDFAARCDLADSVTRSQYGLSVLDYIYDPSRRVEDPCDDLLLSSAALLATQTGLAAALGRHGVVPSAVVGSSLGEFIALVVAGRLTFDSALGYVLEFAADATRRMPLGWMAALLGDGQKSLPAFARSLRVDLVSFTCDRHVVIAGRNGQWREVRDRAVEEELTLTVLPVPHAFHTPDVACLAPRLQPVRLEPPGDVSVLRCATAQKVEAHLPDPYATLRLPMRLVDTVMSLPSRERRLVIDLSPGGGLAAALRLADRSLTTRAVMTPFHQEIEEVERVAQLAARAHHA